MVAFLKKLFSFGTKRAEKPSPPRNAEAKKPSTAPVNVFATGNFEHFSLYDILVVFSANNKSAKITILVKGKRAMINVANGYLELAIYHAWMGKDAVIHIFSDIEDDPQSQFVIKPHVPQMPAGKGLRLEPLLQEVAQMLDKKRNTIPV